ncbi:MAG: PepSY domain-containing protein [Proteobacteria bacterium]|nr:PepSY domain-containing protein [Pseudomonadota bacterium]
MKLPKPMELALVLCLGLLSGRLQVVEAHALNPFFHPVSFHFRKYFHPSLSASEADRIALGVYKGRVVRTVLMKQMGGSGLRYKVVIDRHGRSKDVDVDAVTGEILQARSQAMTP